MEYYLEEPPTLESALAGCTADDLRKLASLTGEKPPTRKADIAAVIMRHLQEDRLRSVWQRLDELQQAAVAEVVHADSGRFDAARFRAKYGKDPDWGSEYHDGYNGQPSPLHFFFYGSMMPADLKRQLKTFVPQPRPLEVAALDQLPSQYDRPFEHWNPEKKIREAGTEPVPLTVHETERAATRELISVLRLVDAGKVAVSDKTRRASASTIEAITALLDGGDYYPHVPAKSKWDDENAGAIRAFAWPLLVQAGGLAQLSGTRLQLTKTGRKALSEPAAATIRTLWDKWMGTTMFDELARIDCVKGQNGKAKRSLTAASSRREVIAGSLAGCPAGRWIATDELLRYMQASGHDFSVARDAWGLYICDPQYGSLGYDGSEEVLNQRYVLALLLEYAGTLGVIDVALIPPAGARRDFRKLWGTDELPFFSRYDGFMYFRITPLGAWCLGAESEYQPAPVEVKPVLRILPNLEIAATGPALEQSDRLALNAYALPVSEFVWRIEAGKLLAAIEEGRPVEELREFLTARSGAPIPDTVARLLDDVAERCTKVHDRGLARLIECADAALAALIANDTRTRKHCLRAGERHLVVPSASEAAFRRALKDAGYLLSTGVTRRRAAGA
jgi:XPB/Ssl2-like helicase family protein